MGKLKPQRFVSRTLTTLPTISAEHQQQETVDKVIGVGVVMRVVDILFHRLLCELVAQVVLDDELAGDRAPRSEPKMRPNVAAATATVVPPMAPAASRSGPIPAAVPETPIIAIEPQARP